MDVEAKVLRAFRLMAVPDLGDELLMAYDIASPTRQCGEQAKLGRREGDRRSSLGDGEVSSIDDEPADAVDLGRRLYQVRSFLSANPRTDSRDEIHARERREQDSIGARLQAAYGEALIPLRADRHDRGVGEFAQLVAEGGIVKVRDVGEDADRGLIAEPAGRAVDIRFRVDSEAALSQMRA